MTNQFLVIDRAGRIVRVLDLEDGQTVVSVDAAIVSLDNQSLYLRKLKELTGNYTNRVPQLPTAVELDRWIEGHASEGFSRKIVMIKEVREMTQSGLGESKAFVDWLVAYRSMR